MSNKVPKDIANEIKECVFQEADKENYLARTRIENGKFMTKLLSMSTVGVRLSQYMKKDEVRTYIKDAIINRYAKDKAEQKCPDDFTTIIKHTTGIDSAFVEKDSKLSISLYKGKNSYVVVPDGSYIKWETALRNALIYIATKPFSARSDARILIMLSLFARCQKIPPSDLQLLKKALKPISASVYIYGDS